MKVKAIRMGFYDLKRKKPGSVFTIKSEKEFSKEWMERLDGLAPASVEPPKASEPEVVTNEDEDVI